MTFTYVVKLDSPALDSIAASLKTFAANAVTGLSVLMEIRAKIDLVTANQEKLMALQTTLDAQTSDLADKVAAETTVVASASALISGFKQLLADAIAKAAAAGATAVQLASLSALGDTVDANNTALAAAVAANTAPPPAGP